MNRNYRAHLHSLVYMGLGVAAISAGWSIPVGLVRWEDIGVQPNTFWHFGTLAVFGVALLLKVRWPSAALLLGGFSVAAELTFGVSVGLLICLTDLIYNHGIRAPAPRAKIGETVLAGLAVSVTAATLILGDGASALDALLLSGGILLLPLWWAREVRRGYPAFVEDAVRRRLEEERHAELLGEQRERRRAAVDAERRRMARELHDVVSSQVASIALTSGAVLNAEPETDRDRKALQTIRTTSVDAMSQLRHMVQVLRSQGAEEQDAELLTETTWSQVLKQAEAQGVDVHTRGAPPENLPDTVRWVLLRILQESLTNALKHGDAAARVQLEAQRGSLTLQVDSDQVLQPRSQSGTESRHDDAGTGLLVMAERAQAVGGRLDAGEHQGRWRVEARLPYQEESGEYDT